MDKKLLIPLGGLIIVICFFLPWVKACDTKMSGLELATDEDIGDPAIWLILVTGIVILGGYFLLKHKSNLLTLACSILGIVVLLWKIILPIFKGELRELEASMEIGGFGTILGYILSFIGGVKNKIK
jgi:fumarate reductase subunit D